MFDDWHDPTGERRLLADVYHAVRQLYPANHPALRAAAAAQASVRIDALDDVVLDLHRALDRTSRYDYELVCYFHDMLDVADMLRKQNSVPFPERSKQIIFCLCDGIRHDKRVFRARKVPEPTSVFYPNRQHYQDLRTRIELLIELTRVASKLRIAATRLLEETKNIWCWPLFARPESAGLVPEIPMVPDLTRNIVYETLHTVDLFMLAAYKQRYSRVVKGLRDFYYHLACLNPSDTYRQKPNPRCPMCLANRLENYVKALELSEDPVKSLKLHRLVEPDYASPQPRRPDHAATPDDPHAGCH